MVLDHNGPVLQIRNRRIPALKAKFAFTNVDKLGIFAQIALDFSQEEAHRGISKLVRSSKTLVHKKGMDVVPGQTNMDYRICGS